MSFKLDHRLESDSTYICTIGISQVRLSNDSRYPWLILIPEVDGIYELDELSIAQQLEVLAASNTVSRALRQCFTPHKLNIACLGNIVKQLHIHHVARFEYDETWPGPIWGRGDAVIYTDAAKQTAIKLIRDALNNINQEN
jgi:diadenosine tetraphosphate (Ap4A) HIT family hydrolase